MSFVIKLLGDRAFREVCPFGGAEESTSYAGDTGEAMTASCSEVRFVHNFLCCHEIQEGLSNLIHDESVEEHWF